MVFMELNEKKVEIRAKLKPIDITFRDLTYSVSCSTFKRVKKCILKGVSGDFKSGELTAILGPSGAGKSSLLNILTGFHEPNIGGLVTAVDKSKNSHRRSLSRKDRCFILQEDELTPSFTVYEIMRIAASLKLGRDITDKMKQEIIENILEKIHLSKTKNTRCEKLSGGEKKRLAIALELINNPPVMFLDEPTTGLDSASCLHCITILRDLAKGGRNIICTIHQPTARIFEMFDHVYVIADGMCVYQGSPSNVVPFLRTIDLQCPQYHNPADFILEVVNGEYGQFNSQLVEISKDSFRRNVTPSLKITGIDKYTNLEVIKETEEFSKSCIEPTESQRFFTLLKKCSMKLNRDLITCYLRVATNLLVGVLIGITYANCGQDASKTFSNIGFFVATILYLAYSSVMTGLVKFLNELNAIKKERFNNWYQLTTFYFAFLFVNIPVQLVFTMVYVIPAYYLTSQILSYERFLKFSLICILINLQSEGLGLIFGTIASLVNGVFLGTVCACFFLAFAGFHILLPHMTEWFYYISYSSCYRYGFTGLLKAIYGDDRDPLMCPKSYVICMLRYPRDILRYFGVNEDGYFYDVVIMSSFTIFFYFVAFFSLRYRIRYGYVI